MRSITLSVLGVQLKLFSAFDTTGTRRNSLSQQLSQGALRYRVNPVCALCEANRPDIQVSGLFCITPFRTRECLPCAALQHLSALCGGNNVSRGGTALLDFAGCVRPRQGVPALLLNLTRSAGACFFGCLGHLFFPVIPSFFHLFLGASGGRKRG